MSRMMIPGVVASVLLTAQVTDAATVLTEGFTYPDGPLTTAPGSPWVNHSGTEEQADVTSGMLNLTFAESEDINAPLSGSPYSTGVLTAEFEVTFSALPSSSGSYFAHFKDNANGFRGRVFALTSGAATDSFRLALSNATGTAAVTVPLDLALATTYAVTLTWDLNTNQSSLSLNGGTAVTATDAASAISATSFAFRQASGIGTMRIDNLSVSYVPEPGSIALAVMGCLVFMKRRRG